MLEVVLVFSLRLTLILCVYLVTRSIPAYYTLSLSGRTALYGGLLFFALLPFEILVMR